jgi:hypothetical protein
MPKSRWSWGAWHAGRRLVVRMARKGRVYRIARDSQPAVINIGGYAVDQHSRESESARRLRQLAA